MAQGSHMGFVKRACGSDFDKLVLLFCEHEGMVPSSSSCLIHEAMAVFMFFLCAFISYQARLASPGPPKYVK